jgi:hypothetical protein
MANSSASSEAVRPPEVAKLLNRVKDLLDSDKPQEALNVLSRDDSEWARNARGVCYLRLGDPRTAVEVLRGLVVARHLSLKPEAPTQFKTNFATALLLSGNISGGISTLDEIRDEADPTVQKLRAAIQRWKGSMTFWQRMSWGMGGEPPFPLPLDFAPGDF